LTRNDPDNATLGFLLEELSAKEMRKGILPRILPPEVHPEFKVFVAVS
jgi:hypothetical protein